MRNDSIAILACMFTALTASAGAAESADFDSTHNRNREDLEAENRYHFNRQATYFFVDFLGDDEAETLGLETDAAFGLGNVHGRHIAYLEVADYPRTIPGKATNPEPQPGALQDATGIGDLLTGFWFSEKKEEHRAWEFGYGLGLQFPTASDDSLGTGKWSAGPSIDIEYKNGNFFAGTIIMQLWSYAGDNDRKSVNMTLAKYFLMYDLNPHWKLISIPYGVTYYWNKPSSEAFAFPVGGGIQRNLLWGKQELSLHLQGFYYVERPTKGSEGDVRLTLEWYF